MNKVRYLVFLFIAIVVIQASVGASIYILFDTLEEAAYFSGMFDSVNTLFAGLAFAGVIYAILIQTKQLDLQRQELALTRIELQRAAAAQEASQKTLNQTMSADHERRKKQATMDYMTTVRPIWAESRRSLNDAFGNRALTEDNLNEIDSSRELQRVVRELLSKLEHLAVGVNTGVLDPDIIYRMSGSYLIRIYRRVGLYLEKAQKKNPYAYVEFLEMIRNFEEQRRVRPDPRGGIDDYYLPKP